MSFLLALVTSLRLVSCAASPSVFGTREVGGPTLFFFFFFFYLPDFVAKTQNLSVPDPHFDDFTVSFWMSL